MNQLKLIRILKFIEMQNEFGLEKENHSHQHQLETLPHNQPQIIIEKENRNNIEKGIDRHRHHLHLRQLRHQIRRHIHHLRQQ